MFIGRCLPDWNRFHTFVVASRRASLCRGAIACGRVGNAQITKKTLKGKENDKDDSNIGFCGGLQAGFQQIV